MALIKEHIKNKSFTLEHNNLIAHGKIEEGKDGYQAFVTYTYLGKEVLKTSDTHSEFKGQIVYSPNGGYGALPKIRTVKIPFTNLIVIEGNEYILGRGCEELEKPLINFCNMNNYIFWSY